MQSKLDEAANFLSVAVQQDPALASAWYHRGLLAERISDSANALQAYRKAYELALGVDPELAGKAAERHNAVLTGGG